jgi:hypothetical protein
VQLDGGTEFQPILKSYPTIQFHISCPYTPQQNDLVERRHRHVVELGLTTMFHASIPQTYWPDIFKSVTFVINHLPSSSLSFDTPHMLYLEDSQIIPSSKFLIIVVIPLYDPTCQINLHYVLPHVFSWVIQHYTRATNVSTLIPIKFSFPAMLSILFHSKISFILLLPHPFLLFLLLHWLFSNQLQHLLPHNIPHALHLFPLPLLYVSKHDERLSLPLLLQHPIYLSRHIKCRLV